MSSRGSQFLGTLVHRVHRYIRYIVHLKHQSHNMRMRENRYIGKLSRKLSGTLAKMPVHWYIYNSCNPSPPRSLLPSPSSLPMLLSNSFGTVFFNWEKANFGGNRRNITGIEIVLINTNVILRDHLRNVWFCCLQNNFDALVAELYLIIYDRTCQLKLKMKLTANWKTAILSTERKTI